MRNGGQWVAEAGGAAAGGCSSRRQAAGGCGCWLRRHSRVSLSAVHACPALLVSSMQASTSALPYCEYSSPGGSATPAAAADAAGSAASLPGSFARRRAAASAPDCSSRAVRRRARGAAAACRGGERRCLDGIASSRLGCRGRLFYTVALWRMPLDARDWRPTVFDERRRVTRPGGRLLLHGISHASHLPTSLFRSTRLLLLLADTGAPPSSPRNPFATSCQTRVSHTTH